MRKVKRFGIILGILLIATILLSGSAVAPWIVSTAGSINCTNQDEALGSNDGDCATVGENPSTLGVLLCDLGAGNEMGASQLFTVYGFDDRDNINETYEIIIYNENYSASYGPYYGWDSEKLNFTTPALPSTPDWRFYQITGTSGFITDANTVDIYYGPEIDAVGW